jgi:hypothetical protein
MREYRLNIMKLWATLHLGGFVQTTLRSQSDWRVGVVASRIIILDRRSSPTAGFLEATEARLVLPFLPLRSGLRAGAVRKLTFQTFQKWFLVRGTVRIYLSIIHDEAALLGDDEFDGWVHLESQTGRMRGRVIYLFRIWIQSLET